MSEEGRGGVRRREGREAVQEAQGVDDVPAQDEQEEGLADVQRGVDLRNGRDEVPRREAVHGRPTRDPPRDEQDRVDPQPPRGFPTPEGHHLEVLFRFGARVVEPFLGGVHGRARFRERGLDPVRRREVREV